MKEFPSNVVAKGDIVLLEDDNTKRIQWKMGMVERLITGKDGQVRRVEVRIISQGKTHFLSRPIQKIYHLEIPGVSVEKRALSEIGDQKEEVEAKCDRKWMGVIHLVRTHEGGEGGSSKCVRMRTRGGGGVDT